MKVHHNTLKISNSCAPQRCFVSCLGAFFPTQLFPSCYLLDVSHLYPVDFPEFTGDGGDGDAEAKRVESRCWKENQTQGVEWQLRTGLHGSEGQVSEQTVSTAVAFEPLFDSASPGYHLQQMRAPDNIQLQERCRHQQSHLCCLSEV